jgi:hypothetical protein
LGRLRARVHPRRGRRLAADEAAQRQVEPDRVAQMWRVPGTFQRDETRIKDRRANLWT